MAKLDGKIALISGGTTGIGAETAKLFQSEGATVVVTGSSERSVEAAKAALPGIEVLVSDAGNVAATKVLVDQVKTKHGRIDVLSSMPASPSSRRSRRSMRPFTTASSMSTSRAPSSCSSTQSRLFRTAARSS